MQYIYMQAYMNLPKTILIISQKGGVGKTTIADEILFALDRRGSPYTFFELDDQGGNVHKAIKNPEAEFVVVDTPGGLSDDYPKWIHASDLVILPTKPSVRDMQPFLRTSGFIRRNIRPTGHAMFVVNMINSRFKASKDYLEWLKTATEDKRQPFTDDYHWCFEYLPQSEMAVQAPAYGKSVIDFAPQSEMARRMEKMNNDIFKLLEK